MMEVLIINIVSRINGVLVFLLQIRRPVIFDGVV